MIIPKEIEKQLRGELELDLPESHLTEDTMFVDKDLCDVLINSGGQKENKQHMDRTENKTDSGIMNGLDLNMEGDLDPIYKFELESVWSKDDECETKFYNFE